MDLFSDLPLPGDESKINQERTIEAASAQEDVNVAAPQLKRKLENADIEDERDEECSNKKTAHSINLNGYVAERKGEREEMQDAHVILTNNDFSNFVNLPVNISRIAYFAVFDGHGGKRAAQYSARHLHSNLATKFPKGGKEVLNLDKEIKRYFIDAFKKTDEDFLKEASENKPVWKDGSTATTVLVINDVLYIANLGDSKALLCRYNQESHKSALIPLSKDHNPMAYEERMRIQKAGGTVREGRVNGILEVSRSIGDGRFKHCGVSNVPDVKRCQLTANDRFILLACDGLWKAFTLESSLKFIEEILKDQSLSACEGKSLEDVKYETVCQKLASEAVRRGSADNVTCLIVVLHHRQ